VPAGGGRTIFVLPWLGHTLVGTTDNDYDGDIDHVQPAAEDVDYLLAALNGYFDTSFGPEDLTGAYAGVRPLISSADAKKSVDISRKAELYETSSGMITITGGKLTTWRRMAKMAVDRLTEREGREAPCRTDEIPLGQPIDDELLAPVEGVPDESYPHLAGRYGYAAQGVLALAAGHGELAQPIVAGCPDLLAEAVWAARHEQARSVADVLLRRTRLGLLAARELTDSDGKVAERVAAAMAPELGWDAARTAAEAGAWAEAARDEGIAPGDASDLATP
jgi:glycerol-3-phosphate dehydrogenase